MTFDTLLVFSYLQWEHTKVCYRLLDFLFSLTPIRNQCGPGSTYSLQSVTRYNFLQKPGIPILNQNNKNKSCYFLRLSTQSQIYKELSKLKYLGET